MLPVCQKLVSQVVVFTVRKFPPVDSAGLSAYKCPLSLSKKHQCCNSPSLLWQIKNGSKFCWTPLVRKSIRQSFFNTLKSDESKILLKTTYLLSSSQLSYQHIMKYIQIFFLLKNILADSSLSLLQQTNIQKMFILFSVGETSYRDFFLK